MLGKLLSISVLDKIVNPPEEEFTEYQRKLLKARVSLELKLLPEEEVITVIVDYQLHMEDVVYTGIRVSSTFLINDMIRKFFGSGKEKDPVMSLVKPDNFKVNKGIFNDLSNKSISHARAIHAMLIKDTSLDGLFLPLIEDKYFDDKKSVVKFTSDASK